MSGMNFGNALAAREHLLSGKPLTRLEAIVLYGVQGFTEMISDLRKDGWQVEHANILYVAALRRLNGHAILQPPPDLPVRKIYLTEYRVKK